MTRRQTAAVAVPALLVLALGACGDGSSTTASEAASSTAPSPSSSPTSSGPASDPAGNTPLEIVRSGGIAGVRDLVRVAADGSATLLTRDGRNRTCQPAADDVQRLRAADLDAVAALASPSVVVADGFAYSVRNGTGSATVTQGDDSGRRAELLDAAADVVASCLAGQPASGTASPR